MRKLITFILGLILSTPTFAAPGGYPWGFEQPLTSADLNSAFAARVTFSRGALTAHGVILGNGLGDEYAIGSLGNAGQVLTSNGPNADPPPLSGNAKILADIANLEASVTPGMLRSAALGTDGGALAEIDTQVANLRKGLK